MNLSQSIEFNSLKQVPSQSTKVKQVRAKGDLLRSLPQPLHKLLASERFLLLEVPLHALAVIQRPDAQKVEIAAASINNTTNDFTFSSSELIADVNVRKIGQSGAGYYPKVIIVSGEHIHAAAKKVGMERIRCLIGIKAAKKLNLIHADHQIGSSELSALINEQLSKKFPAKKNKSGMVASPMPWIRDVFPLENYFVYSMDGELFKMTYTIDMDKREVTLTGKPQRVVEKYVSLEGRGAPMRQEDAMKFHAGVGSASLGNGSGPAPTNATPLMSKKMKAKKGKKAKMRAEFTNIPYDSSPGIKRRYSPSKTADIVTRPRRNHQTLSQPDGADGNTKVTSSVQGK